MSDPHAISSATKPPAAIGPDERARRAAHAFDRLPKHLGSIVLFDDEYIQYFTGFLFHPTERPIALVITPDGQRTLFVPELEREHAGEAADAEHVEAYPEYPGETHPSELLLAYLRRGGLVGDGVGVDHDGYPPLMGHVPRPLSAQLPIERISPHIDWQMAHKSEAELALIRESARWGNRAHELLQRYTAVGEREDEVSRRASMDATREMVEALGEGYRPRNRHVQGAVALYRGQIGPNSALPHAVTMNATFKEGDTLVTGAAADVWGYVSELERTMILGTPSSDQKRYFAHMLALQDLAFDSMRPGTAAGTVDRVLRSYIEDHQLTRFWRHHVGHSLGQRSHESPFLDIGDASPLEPGMVFSVEPGLYVPGLGGFRHSDTIVVTDDGIERLTVYPRDLGSLTLEA